MFLPRFAGLRRARSFVSSVDEVRRLYPNEWVAIAVRETDDDGLALAGVLLVHDGDERFVWTAAHLGESDDPIYVFFTGPQRGNAGKLVQISNHLDKQIERDVASAYQGDNLALT
jgi:hypothetical protein